MRDRQRQDLLLHLEVRVTGKRLLGSPIYLPQLLLPAPLDVEDNFLGQPERVKESVRQKRCRRMVVRHVQRHQQFLLESGQWQVLRHNLIISLVRNSYRPVARANSAHLNSIFKP